MRFRHVLLVALVLIFVLALVLFLVSKYAPFILPQDLSSDLLLWGVVITAVATFVAAIKDVVELVEKAASSESRAHATELVTLFVQSRVDAINTRNREIMLKKVEVFWVKGVLESSLHGALLLQLGMEYRSDMVDHPWDMVLQRSDQPSQVLPEGTRMVEVFDELGGSFLILGEPGSGKTTALLELARDLIARANQNDTHPIPVVFSLSSWGESRKNIEDWLVDELNTKYDVPNYVGEGWVEGDEVLLLLDGLDEVREEHRDQCVDAINQFCRKHMMNIVVCSRTHDYKALTNRLMLPGAIIQKPLTSKQIDRYLASLGSKLRGVRKAIRTDTILQELARSPLVLSIITLAYWGMSIDDFRPGTLEERRNHLFVTYVNRMFEHRKIIEKYKSDQIIRRLIWLGKLMKRNAQTIFHIEQLQPSALSSGIARAIYIAMR
jgi:DNA polymerase III delta prime subunit